MTTARTHTDRRTGGRRAGSIHAPLDRSGRSCSIGAVVATVLLSGETSRLAAAKPAQPAMPPGDRGLQGPDGGLAVTDVGPDGRSPWGEPGAPPASAYPTASDPAVGEPGSAAGAPSSRRLTASQRRPELLGGLLRPPGPDRAGRRRPGRPGRSAKRPQRPGRADDPGPAHPAHRDLRPDPGGDRPGGDRGRPSAWPGRPRSAWPCGGWPPRSTMPPAN